MASSHKADGGAYAQPVQRGKFSIDDTFEVTFWMRDEYSYNEVQHPCSPLVADYTTCQKKHNGPAVSEEKTIYSFGGSTALIEEAMNTRGKAGTEMLRKEAQYDPRAAKQYERLGYSRKAVDEDECTRMEQMYAKCMKMAPSLPTIPVKLQVQSPRCPDLMETFKVCMQENEYVSLDLDIHHTHASPCSNQTRYCSVQYRALMHARCNLGSKLPMRYPSFADRLTGRDAGSDTVRHPASAAQPQP